MVMGKEQILELLSRIESGYKSPADPFFDNGNKLIKQYEKQGILSTLDDEQDLHRKNSITCNVFGCNQVFETVFAFESHYNSLHRYLCNECKKNLPSAHILDLHISETHDSYFSAQAERKPMYSCFLSECKHKSANAEERKDHCIREHKFPPNFRFDNSVNTKSIVKGAKLKLKKCTDTEDVQMCGDKKSPNTSDVEEVSKKFTNITFGHHKVKAFNKGSHAGNKKNESSNAMETSPLENAKTVIDLMDSLPG